MTTPFTELTISNITPGSSAYLAYDTSAGFRLFQPIQEGTAFYLKDITSPTPPAALYTLATNAIVGGSMVTVTGATVTDGSFVIGKRYKILTIGTTAYNSYGNSIVTAGAFEIGKQYIILTVGSTDYTLIGASDNTIGTIFTASGIGAGDGTVYPQYFTATSVGGSGGGTVCSDFSELARQVGQPIKINGIWCTINSFISNTAISVDRIVTTGPIYYPSYYPNLIEDTIIGLISVTSINATAIELGKTYQILSPGTTNFMTLFGAANNSIGTQFTSIAAGTGGSGTGTVTYYTIDKYFTAENTIPIGSLAVSGTVIGESRIDIGSGDLYIWSGTVWVPSGASASEVILSAIAPGAPTTGMQWFRTTDSRMFMWNGTTWIQTLPGVSGTRLIDITTINGLYEGETVIDSTDGNMYIWDTGAWVLVLESVAFDLTNQVHGAPSLFDGTGVDLTGASTGINVFSGASDVTSLWTITKSESTGVTGTLTSPGPGKLYTVTSLTADLATVEFTASRTGYASRVATFTIIRVRAGESGTGSVYQVSPSVGAVKYNLTTYTPTTVTFSNSITTGATVPSSYSGRIVISYSTNGSTYTEDYPPNRLTAIDQSSVVYTPSVANIKFIKADLYLAGGYTSLLDTENIPVIIDGAPGAQGLQGTFGVQGTLGATGSQGLQGRQGILGTTGNQGTVGSTGAQGLQGILGPTGQQGTVGSTGAQGLQGILGPTGQQGTVGSTGAQGLQGILGPTGQQGTVGSTGGQGAQGSLGPTGQQGVVGSTGGPGTQGSSGPTGQQGVVGSVGPQGLQGNLGPTGQQGVVGSTGGPGAQGSLGPTGQQGLVGSTGGPGAQGNLGPTGQQGIAGPTGGQGAQGNLGPTGQQGVVGSTGGPGTQGSSGPTGQQGVVGSVGPQGLQGNLGPTGQQGVVGSTGGPGAQGSSGPTGQQGVVGSAGSQGAQGNLGPTGQQGVVGSIGGQGLQGNLGPTGQQGTVGAIGSQGIQGTLGPTGQQGITGPTGSQGAQGNAGPVGQQGIVGAIGLPGSQGAAGPSGPGGALGPAGSTGPTGASLFAYYSSSDITTLDTFPSPADWISGAVYTFNQVVYYGNAIYAMKTIGGITGVTTNPFSDTTNWIQVFANGAAIGDTVSVPNFVIGKTYRITATGGTNFTSFGSSSSTVGTYFVCTAGSQTGAGTAQLVIHTNLTPTIYVGGESRFRCVNNSHFWYVNATQVAGGVTAVKWTIFATEVNSSNIGNEDFGNPILSIGQTGSPGVAGAPGAAGAQGPNGVQGNAGATGPQGTTGTQGSQGRQGILGTDGAQGTAGTQGSQGRQGILGTDGAQGTAGTQGSQGRQGILGTDGAQGTAGSQGSQGRQGILGTTGSQGTTGTQGSQGGQGILGATGSQGTTGTQGSQGGQGILGATGSQGTTGTQGSQGGQGILGATGSQGTTGTQGSQGRQGILGTDGAQGTTGTQGSQGRQGILGTDGAQGTAGTQGSQGRQGILGANGAQGQAGAQGPAGLQGVVGSVGAPGSQGTSGPDGPQGVLGPAGAPGGTGSTGPAGPAGSSGNAVAFDVTGTYNNASGSFSRADYIRLYRGTALVKQNDVYWNISNGEVWQYQGADDTSGTNDVTFVRLTGILKPDNIIGGVPAAFNASAGTDYYNLHGSSGTFTFSASPVCTTFNGVGTITYAWSVLSYAGAGAPTLTNSTAQQCTIARSTPMSVSITYEGTLQCIATDSSTPPRSATTTWNWIDASPI